LSGRAVEFDDEVLKESIHPKERRNREILLESRADRNRAAKHK
jgi:hypothetical protein